ncbi:alpha-glucuronidase [bacterium]|nr:alpha-glucuronidase [bacterium]
MRAAEKNLTGALRKTAVAFLILGMLPAFSEDGYELWLRYRRMPEREGSYRDCLKNLLVPGKSATAEVIRKELRMALPALSGAPVSFLKDQAPLDQNLAAAGCWKDLEAAGILRPGMSRQDPGDEGFFIRMERQGQQRILLVAGDTDVSALYGVFHLLRLLQTGMMTDSLSVISLPAVRLRLLNHWDNLDGSIERGYAGRSLWNWSGLPPDPDPRLADYARACASIGINGTVLNNVNASAEILTSPYLEKIEALAGLFRPYGIRIYLSAQFSAPMILGGLKTSDPREPAVAGWWAAKAEEIYNRIPDFGGFLVKANSEGQPGPQDFGATHSDGANMLAAALAPHGGVVIWRAFVYDTSIDPDRAKCAYREFTPLDGRFGSRVLVQAKNGPIDFQPREPFHPLFGAMPHTPMMLELQITQEYLGQSKHLVYLAPMWKEILKSDTYVRGPGSTVGRIVDGSLEHHVLSGMAGVANTGDERDWCGHPFAQANWYAFGRLAWDHTLHARDLADEWIRMTWSLDPAVVDSIKSMMSGSWEACVNYMTPLGLCHIMQEGHHYGPDPGFNRAARPDWNSTYYHRADSSGIGFDRTTAGSDAVSQYAPPLRDLFNDLETCPEKFLLWFHHVPWGHRMQSGKTLWEEMQERYKAGFAYVSGMRNTWKRLKNELDPERWMEVDEKLRAQEENARVWRDVCLDYFGRFAER